MAYFPSFEGLNLLVYIGLILLISQASGRIANLCKLPRLIGYILVGIIFGPSVLKLFDHGLVRSDLVIVTDIALAIIAFSIGGALKLKRLHGLKASIVWITLFQVVFAVVVVFGLTVWLLPHFISPDIVSASTFKGSFLPVALVLGAISAATAPAAIMSIIREYKAKGPFTSVLLGVVALDDALTIIFFAFTMGIAHTLVAGGEFSVALFVVHPLLSVLYAIILGAIIGLLRRAMLFIEAPEFMFGLVIGAIFLTSGLAASFDVSPLLACMTLGFVIANFVKQTEEKTVFKIVQNIEEPLFGMFFLLAGAHLDLSVAFYAGWLVLVLMAGRFFGKISGSYVGAVFSHAPVSVRKYLGISLLPSAGVTMGLALAANAVLSPLLPQLSSIMISAVVGKILLNELLTPFLVRYALFKTKEANKA